MINKLRRLLLYGGLEKKQFLSISKEIYAENQTILYYSLIASIILLTLLAVFAVFLNPVNVITYIIADLLMAGLFAAYRFWEPLRKKWTNPMVCVFKYILYFFSINVSLLHREYPAVSVIVMIAVLSMLFVYQPAFTIVETFAVMLVCCILSYIVKPHEVAVMDTWNLLSFFCVAAMENSLFMMIKLRGIYQSKRVVIMSETDLLTGVRNRNAYEKDINQYAGKCRNSLLCIYSDVNGLHELNNSQGHIAGDRMLKAITGEMTKRFGAANVYRTGGDEFVIFQPDGSLEKGLETIQDMERCFQEMGYHVSFGAAWHEIDEMDIMVLIRQAENKMYSAKRLYYINKDHDRRRHDP